MRDFKWNIGFIMQEKQAYKDYYFTNPEIEDGEPQDRFRFTDFQIGFRFAFREKVVETTKGQISFGSKYPVVWFNYTQGVSGLFNGMYQYSRFDLRVKGTKHFKYIGDFSFTLMAGITLGEVPASNLYFEPGTFHTFTLFAPNSFGTMRVNEFLSDRYASLFLTYNFGNFGLNYKWFHPEFLAITNLSIGDLKNKSGHQNITYKTLNLGYYESGLIIRKLLDFNFIDLGAGVLYRYGPYGFVDISRNFAYKFSIFYGF